MNTNRTSQKTKPRLFLIEDSRELSAQVTRLADRLGWQVTSAASLEMAKNKFAYDDGQFNAAFVDLMLPEDDQALHRVNELLNAREGYSNILIDRSADSQDRDVANKHIDEIDGRLMRLIVDDAGIQFLEYYCGTFKQNGTKIAIFSARRADYVAKPKEMTLADRIKGALGGRDPDAWFEKPVHPLDVEQWLLDVANLASCVETIQ